MEARNVLVVEDDTAISALVAGLLTQAGYHPVTIADHALIDAAVDRWQPRCVILDGEVRATGESRTWDDAAGIRARHPAVPVVIFTADRAALREVRAGRSQRSRDASFAGMVSKPFVVEEFLTTVRRAVDGTGIDVTTKQQASAPGLSISVFPDVGQLAADWPETDLFGTIVHELRGPLTVIRGQVQLARRRVGVDPEREREALDGAIAQVDRMTGLIDELLDHARLASNGLSLAVTRLDLGAVVADAVEAHDYDSVPRTSFERPDQAVTVYADAGRLTQIIDNLLGNALKYSAAGSPVTVTLTVRGTDAEVRVSDRGVGIPETERALLFTPFYRSSRTRDVRGTGLGLHISRQLAERHRGRLYLESSSATGSVFVLSLPVAANGAPLAS